MDAIQLQPRSVSLADFEKGGKLATDPTSSSTISMVWRTTGVGGSWADVVKNHVVSTGVLGYPISLLRKKQKNQ